jgi:hypothetical protein
LAAVSLAEAQNLRSPIFVSKAETYPGGARCFITQWTVALLTNIRLTFRNKKEKNDVAYFASQKVMKKEV